ncbi:peptidoglycan editing factor PgeF [Desulfobacula phenolica]|uniref:Purine nucleoside phosphorylase n=1 Tax=Desulfobacula phenolica TaxID=90732 RepID=A0A1H2GD47_9BACT|nr:peptidoglycan editing factor PgeF [Desulfobacula phenolica]SDU17485.1 conserved hypothetical protein [Desulfobacula phenolica]
MENNNINVYEFELFKACPDIVHGIFTRMNKTLATPFDFLRIGIDSKIGRKSLVFLNQVHGDKIKVLKKYDTKLTENFDSGKETSTADGVITNIKDVALVIRVADCQSVMMYDPVQKIIANIHSGWRGSVKNIIGNCLDKMILEFGCQPEDVIAGISPSLGPCCSEFINYKAEIPKKIWKYKIEDKNYFDFWEMSSDQLLDKGVKKEHIENMEICTKCHTDLFYSFRGEKTDSRFACVISMR